MSQRLTTGRCETVERCLTTNRVYLLYRKALTFALFTYGILVHVQVTRRFVQKSPEQIYFFFTGFTGTASSVNRFPSPTTGDTTNSLSMSQRNTRTVIFVETTIQNVSSVILITSYSNEEERRLSFSLFKQSFKGTGEV